MITKTCPKCSAALFVRQNSETQEEFLGCSRFPDCRHTEPLPTHIVKARRGDPMLPGFELAPDEEPRR